MQRSAWVLWGCLGPIAMAPGCHRSQQVDDAAQAVKTRDMLRRCRSYVLVAQAESSNGPPLVAPTLIKWASEHIDTFSSQDFVDPQHEAIRDAWGNNVVLIAFDGKLAGFGSKGPNGIWEGGNTDDIVVYLTESE